MFSSTKSFLIPLTLQLALHTAFSSADAVINWTSYPPNSVDCLNSAQSSANCPSANVTVWNECVCKNGFNFLNYAAACLGQSDPSDVAGVYNQLKTNCDGTTFLGDTYFSITEAQWNSWASTTTTVGPTPSSSTITKSLTATTTTSTASSATTTSTAYSGTTTNPAAPSHSRLGTGPIVGIAVGSAVAIAIVGLIALLLRRRGHNGNQQPVAPSAGIGEAEPYKDPSKQPPGFGRPQETYYNAPQSYPQYPQGQYAGQHMPYQGYAQAQQLASPYGAQVPDGPQSLPQYGHQPSEQYSELASEPGPGQQRVELPGR